MTAENKQLTFVEGCGGSHAFWNEDDGKWYVIGTCSASYQLQGAEHAFITNEDLDSLPDNAPIYAGIDCFENMFDDEDNANRLLGSQDDSSQLATDFYTKGDLKQSAREVLKRFHGKYKINDHNIRHLMDSIWCQAEYLSLESIAESVYSDMLDAPYAYDDLELDNDFKARLTNLQNKAYQAGRQKIADWYELVLNKCSEGRYQKKAFFEETGKEFIEKRTSLYAGLEGNLEDFEIILFDHFNGNKNDWLKDTNNPKFINLESLYQAILESWLSLDHNAYWKKVYQAIPSTNVQFKIDINLEKAYVNLITNLDKEN